MSTDQLRNTLYIGVIPRIGMCLRSLRRRLWFGSFLLVSIQTPPLWSTLVRLQLLAVQQAVLVVQTLHEVAGALHL